MADDDGVLLLKLESARKLESREIIGQEKSNCRCGGYMKVKYSIII